MELIIFLAVVVPYPAANEVIAELEQDADAIVQLYLPAVPQSSITTEVIVLVEYAPLW